MLNQQSGGGRAAGFADGSPRATDCDEVVGRRIEDALKLGTRLVETAKLKSARPRVTLAERYAGCCASPASQTFTASSQSPARRVLFGKLRSQSTPDPSRSVRRRSSIRGLSATPTLWDDCELIRLTCRPKLSVIVSVTL